jgi:hypothetical protein
MFGAHAPHNARPAKHIILSEMQTKRRIAVTAAPHASNLLEYHAVANWAVPGALVSSDVLSDVFLKPVMIDGLLESDVEAWDRGGCAAGLLVNRIKTFAFPLRRANSSNQPAGCRQSLSDEKHGGLHRHTARISRDASTELDIALAATFLQAAATHPLALTGLAHSIAGNRLPNSSPPLVKELANLRSLVVRRILHCVDAKASLLDEPPSGKLAVVTKFPFGVRRPVAIFCTAVESMWVMHAGQRKEALKLGLAPNGIVELLPAMPTWKAFLPTTTWQSAGVMLRLAWRRSRTASLNGSWPADGRFQPSRQLSWGNAGSLWPPSRKAKPSFGWSWAQQ